MKTISDKPLAIFGWLFAAMIVFSAGAHFQARAAATKAAVATKKKPNPDILVFSNGDKLAGKLDHEADGTLFFNSTNAGTVQVKWGKFKSLETQGAYAVIEKGIVVGRKQPNRDVPRGTLTIEGSTLTVHTTQGAVQVPVSKVAYLIDEATFDKNVLHKQGLLQGITGSITAGASTVSSTQNSASLSSAVLLTRAVPAVTWMPPRDRTLLNFTSNYGKVTQTGTPTVTTNIIHGSIEEDEYFSPRFYVLQQAVYDHNSTQGLDLQQLYGVGIGYTASKNARQELDLTAIMAYTRQAFTGVFPNPATTQNIVGSSFGDNYTRNFRNKKIVLTEVGQFNPAWNILADYSANVSVGATFAVYKNLGFTLGVIDSYLNDPPTGFQGNSVQFNAGLTYTISH